MARLSGLVNSLPTAAPVTELKVARLANSFISLVARLSEYTSLVVVVAM